MNTPRHLIANRSHGNNDTPSFDPTQFAYHLETPSSLVLPEDEENALQRRVGEWGRALGPVGACENWLVEHMAVNSIRIDRCAHHEIALRNRQARRASVCWEEDRRVAVEEIAVGLDRKPALVARRLQSSRHGCEWLIERWEMLARIVEERGAWDEKQRSLALDLLGVPLELRDGPTRVDARPNESAAVVQSALAKAEIERLRRAKAQSLDELDAWDRRDAEIGLGAELSRPLQQLLRYEGRCSRNLHWARNQLHKLQSARDADTPARPSASLTKTEPERPITDELLGEDPDSDDVAEESTTAPDDLPCPASRRDEPPRENRRARRARQARARQLAKAGRAV